MTKSNIIREIESNLYRIEVINDKIILPSGEQHANHIYVVKPLRASLSFTIDKLSAEIEYFDKPNIFNEQDLVYIYMDKLSIKKRVEEEKIKIYGKSLVGYSKPLILRIREEYDLLLTINDKYFFRANKIELDVKDVESILNILVYPLKIAWIYIADGKVSLKSSDEKIEVNIIKSN
ncbi:MAG: hypothetical protein B6U89_06750 [Desulfurococcales archaeon ex4484_58]|nr:MAG: hypothetical protein B6U89_06750 [Desulfurococcales archaeon ex4484_58]